MNDIHVYSIQTYEKLILYDYYCQIMPHEFVMKMQQPPSRLVCMIWHVIELTLRSSCRSHLKFLTLFLLGGTKCALGLHPFCILLQNWKSKGFFTIGIKFYKFNSASKYKKTMVQIPNITMLINLQ